LSNKKPGVNRGAPEGYTFPPEAPVVLKLKYTNSI